MNGRRSKIEIDVETNGFEEATEKVEALANAYDSFPVDYGQNQGRIRIGG